ncbi:MAG TPA: hypothetical protein VI488_16965 [Candidatus Angelobacter sp.]
MLAKRFVFALLVFVAALSRAALAQKADAAFVVGASFVSDSTATFAVPCLLPPCPASPTFISTVQTSHQVFLEGNLGLQLLNAKVAALYFEIPVAGIPSQTLHLSTAPSVVFAHMSSTYVTPGFRLKLLPGAPIAPFVSLGGGWAHYSLSNGATNKGAIDYGGGLDFKTGIRFLGLRGEVRDFVTGDPNFGLAGAIPGGFTGSGNQSGLHHPGRRRGRAQVLGKVV